MSKEAIEDRLRSEKPVRNAPTGLTEAVLSRISAPDTKAEHVRARILFWPRFALGIAVVAMACVIAGEFWRRPGTPLASGMAASNITLQTEQAVASIERVEVQIPTITPEQLQALTEKIDQPLEIELKNVISDTRLEIQFVASNFLPEQ